MRKSHHLGVLAVLTTLTACSSHSSAHPTPTVTITKTATPSTLPETWTTPSPQPDYCTMKNPPKDFASTVIHDTHVIEVAAADPNPDGGVTILARETCHVAPAYGDDGTFWPTGPVRTYVILPTAQIDLTASNGLQHTQISMSDFINRIHQHHPRIQGDWFDGDVNFEIATDGPTNITSFKQLWHP